MWECSKCKEKIEDRYAHCWNCGTAKTEAQKEFSHVRVHLKNEPPSEKEIRVENVPQPEREFPPEKELPPENEFSPENELLPKEKIRYEETFLFENEYSSNDKSPSKIGKIVLPFLWLAAAVAVAVFAYYSSQKTTAFENRIAEEAKNLNAQANQFVFAKNAPREKNAVVKAKVLPLSAQTNQLDGLYNFLPDDLRPANLEEVKTVLWLDCKPAEAGRYEDGSAAYQDSCNAYLVDRNTSKVIQVQDFLGELPPLKKQWGSSYASGKVLPETYISYIKGNQPAAERSPARLVSDSPDHHFWFKSELLYATILLVLLGAAGIGWMVYQIKSAIRKNE